jgi:tRNA(adenine34) deaminase
MPLKITYPSSSIWNRRLQKTVVRTAPARSTKLQHIANTQSLDKFEDGLYAIKAALCALHKKGDALISDEVWMKRALELAAGAGLLGEIPVGAIVVQGDEIIAEAANFKEQAQDPLGHAEIRALQLASERLGRWRLTGCTLYVTLEPCTMCAGAIIHSRVDRLVYGATDPKAGAVASLYQILADPRLNHLPSVTSGVLADASGKLLKDFFAALRARKAK